MKNSANEITKQVLLAIPQVHRLSRAWRANTGAGVPYSAIRAAVALLAQGRTRDCLEFLQRQRPITFGIPGQADITGILAPGGKRLEIEIKADGDKTRPEQEAFRIMMARADGIYITASSEEDAIQQLEDCRG